MKIRNGEIINRILPVVEKIGGEGPPKLPVLTVLKVRKMLRVLRPHVQDLMETRNDFLQQWGQKDDNGQLVMVGQEVKFPEGHRVKFIAAEAQLYSAEWEYPGPTVTLADLGKMQITGGLLADLGDLFCTDGEKSEKE